MRLRREEGFGMLELLIAVVMLTVGILALMGVFAAGTMSLRNSASTSNGTAVADKAMEVYRELENCGIYLTSTTIPTSSSQYYTQYYADTSAFDNVGVYSGANPYWVTETTTGSGYSPIPPSNSNCLPNPVPSPDPRSATQTVVGPDGLNYLVFSYVVLAQPSGPSGTYTSAWVKQVTVRVFSPKNTSLQLAKESSVFAANAAS